MMLRSVLHVLAAFTLSAAAFAQPKMPPDYRRTGAPIPPFVLGRPDGHFLTNAILQPGKAVAIMIFSPQCDHCERRLDTLKMMQQSLRNTQLIFVAEARTKPYMIAFMKKMGMDTGRLFRYTGNDTSGLIYHIYTYGLLPQFNVYNPKHRLVHTFAGNFPMDSLRLYLH